MELRERLALTLPRILHVELRNRCSSAHCVSTEPKRSWAEYLIPQESLDLARAVAWAVWELRVFF